MQSKATTVDEYMKEVPADRLEAVTRLRAMCREFLPGYEEAMSYGMPAYSKACEDGESGVAFNSQKQYISFYVTTSVVDKYRDQLPNAGKCCIRYTKPEKIDWDVVRKLLEDTVTADVKFC